MTGFIIRKLSKLYPIQALRWIKVWKSIPVSDWITGAKYFRCADYRTAASFYQNGLIKHPTHRAADCARLDLAYCELKIGNLSGAESILKSMISQETTLKESYLLLNQIYRYEGNYFEAVNVSSHGLRLFPGYARIIAAHAHTCFSMPYFVSLIEESKALLDLYYRTGNNNEDDDRLIETAIADFECRYGDVNEGEKILSRILAAGNAPFEAILLKGKLLIDAKRYDQARHLLQKAQVCAPENPLPSAYLAVSYLDEGEPAWALEHGREACRLGSWNNVYCFRVFVESLKCAGDDGSLELFEAKLDKLVLEEELQIRKLRILSDPALITREIANRS